MKKRRAAGILRAAANRLEAYGMRKFWFFDSCAGEDNTGWKVCCTVGAVMVEGKVKLSGASVLLGQDWIEVSRMNDMSEKDDMVRFLCKRAGELEADGEGDLKVEPLAVWSLNAACAGE